MRPGGVPPNASMALLLTIVEMPQQLAVLVANALVAGVVFRRTSFNLSLPELVDRIVNPLA
jgi:23S rRNA C2498 (ribose-2'-O)-methylase RlmM